MKNAVLYYVTLLRVHLLTEAASSGIIRDHGGCVFISASVSISQIQKRVTAKACLAPYPAS